MASVIEGLYDAPKDDKQGADDPLPDLKAMFGVDLEPNPFRRDRAECTCDDTGVKNSQLGNVLPAI